MAATSQLFEGLGSIRVAPPSPGALGEIGGQPKKP
jgi:hypothetical protein